VGYIREGTFVPPGMGVSAGIKSKALIIPQGFLQMYDFVDPPHPLWHRRNRGSKPIHLHGHQTDSVLVITLASVADLSCACSSSSTIRSNSESVMPSGRQMPTALGT
jgi:hypothetical protein